MTVHVTFAVSVSCLRVFVFQFVNVDTLSLVNVAVLRNMSPLFQQSIH